MNSFFSNCCPGFELIKPILFSEGQHIGTRRARDIASNMDSGTYVLPGSVNWTNYQKIKSILNCLWNLTRSHNRLVTANYGQQQHVTSNQIHQGWVRSYLAWMTGLLEFCIDTRSFLLSGRSNRGLGIFHFGQTSKRRQTWFSNVIY